LDVGRRIGDANDLEMIERAFRTFKSTSDRPTLIIVDSHIAYGAPNKQDTSAAHGEPLGEEEIRLAKRHYGWPPDAKFLIVGRVLDILNISVHLKAGKPLDVAGQVGGRDYTSLFVGSRIFCPAINYRLPGLPFLFQAGSNGSGVVWAKDTCNNFFRLLAALLNVYGRHIRRPRTSIGPLVSGQRLGRLCLTRLCLIVGRPATPRPAPPALRASTLGSRLPISRIYDTPSINRHECRWAKGDSTLSNAKLCRYAWPPPVKQAIDADRQFVQYGLYRPDRKIVDPSLPFALPSCSRWIFHHVSYPISVFMDVADKLLWHVVALWIMRV
jgi:hypothetical protein